MSDASSQQQNRPDHFANLFEYAPISLWEQDFSDIKRQFDRLRLEGVASLADYLAQHPDFVATCMQQITVRHVNLESVTMFKADSRARLLTNIKQIFRDGMQRHFHDELLALWAGQLNWSGEGVNYTFEGEALHVLLHWRILPGCEQNWERVLVAIENITARKQLERRLHDLFDAAPISLWEEDYSSLKRYFDELRRQGVDDLRTYLRQNPQAVAHCMTLIQVLDVNQKTVDVFGAQSKAHLLANFQHIFRDEMQAHFEQELVDLWLGKLAYTREGINYALTGEPVNVQLDLRVMPGHEHDLSWVLVAVQDITARKKAEEYLYYLGTHDVLTGLFNRTYFQETLLRLPNQCNDPISIIVGDVNGLKRVNDRFGHAAGDKLIQRTAEVLRAAFDQDTMIARLGGDEFVVVLPGVGDAPALDAVNRIQTMVDLNNKFYSGPPLSVALGVATSQPGITLDKVVSRADDAMYLDKERHHRR